MSSLRSFAAGSLITAAYTFSKSLDYANDLAFDNNLAIRLNRGLSTFDRTHNLVISPAVSTPFGRGRRFLSNGGKAAAVLAGWRFNGIFIARSGSPVPRSSSDSPRQRCRPNPERDSRHSMRPRGCTTTACGARMS